MTVKTRIPGATSLTQEAQILWSDSDVVVESASRPAFENTDDKIATATAGDVPVVDMNIGFVKTVSHARGATGVRWSIIALLQDIRVAGVTLERATNAQRRVAQIVERTLKHGRLPFLSPKPEVAAALVSDGAIAKTCGEPLQQVWS